MIEKVIEKLTELGLSNCVLSDTHFQENSKAVNLKQTRQNKTLKIRVDGCLITESIKKCDCLYIHQTSSNKLTMFLVELKGTHYRDALDQLEQTKRHRNYKSLRDCLGNVNELAIAVVGEKAKTNKPKKEEWENINGIRLHVHTAKQDTVFNLNCLI